jgi:hypothetical protein
LFKPRFAKETNGASATAILFFNDDEIKQSMDDLISWYESEGVKHGDKMPDLAIINFVS